MKKALGSFAIITGVAFIMWVASVLIYCFISGNFSVSFQDYLTPFKNLFTSFNTFISWTIYAYVGFAGFVLTILFLLIWFIVSIAKHKARYLGFIPFVILGFLPLIGTILNVEGLYKPLLTNSALEPKDLIMTILVLACASLETIGYFIFYFVGLAAMGKKSPVSTPEEIDDVNSLADSIPEPTIEEPRVGFEDPQPEPVPTYVEGTEPEGEPAPEPTPEPAPEPTPEPGYGAGLSGIDAATLAAVIRDAVRDIVRDELARSDMGGRHGNCQPSNSHSNITGATFAGPLVVQYFQGGINSVPTPVPEPKKEEPKPEPKQEPVVEQPVVEEQVMEEVFHDEINEQPVVEESIPEPVVEQPVEEPKPEPVVEQPVVEEPTPEPEVVPAPVKEEKPAKVYERISFIDRMIGCDEEMHTNYNILKNEILSYGVKSRVSNSGDTFRLHKKTYVKITIAGKSLKLYFALDPKDYEDTTMPVQDAGHKGIYAEIPLVFKVRSELSMRRCKDLIQTVMEKDNLEQGEILDIDWVEQLKTIADDKANEDGNDE